MNFACFCINLAVAMVTRFCCYGNREGAELSTADTSGSERRQEEHTLLMALEKRFLGHCAVAAQLALSLGTVVVLIDFSHLPHIRSAKCPSCNAFVCL